MSGDPAVPPAPETREPLSWPQWWEEEGEHEFGKRMAEATAGYPGGIPKHVDQYARDIVYRLISDRHIALSATPQRTDGANPQETGKGE